MAPVTRKRNQAAKGKQGEANQCGAKPVPRKRARAAPKASKVDKKQRQDEVDTDEGRKNSREFVASSTKGVKGIKETKKEMRKKADEVTKFIENQLRKESAANDRPEAMEHLLSDTESLLLNVTTSNSTAGGDTQNPTYNTAHECLTSFQALVKDYEALNRSSNEIKKPTWMHWEQDSKDLRALNESVMGVAFQILNSVVMPHAKVKTADHRVKGGGDDIEAMALELLADAKPQRGEETWGTVAHGFLRAFSGAASLLPKADGS